jgi:hypothetical protein
MWYVARTFDADCAAARAAAAQRSTATASARAPVILVAIYMAQLDRRKHACMSELTNINF